MGWLPEVLYDCAVGHVALDTPLEVVTAMPVHDGIGTPAIEKFTYPPSTVPPPVGATTAL